MNDLNERLCYKEGKLFWLNGPRAGKEAGTLDPTTGYKVFRLNKKKLYVHRAIWFLFNGEWPNIIDHINHDKTDNRIQNLRNVTQKENQLNRKEDMDLDNTSGIRGVCPDNERNKWFAYYQNLKLGRFDTKKEACEARRKYEDGIK